jgi:hypothetical protein
MSWIKGDQFDFSFSAGEHIGTGLILLCLPVAVHE